MTNDTDDERINEAEQFWNQYEMPFAHGIAIKVRNSGLSRGSWGDGRDRNTVQHCHVKEAFTDGRLSRSSDTYLCDPGSRVDSMGEEPALEGDLEKIVTCETCKERMERWKCSIDEPSEAETDMVDEGVLD